MKKRDDYNKYMRDYMRKRHAKRRAWALSHLGGKCVRCESTEKLEIDHIVRESKQYTLERAFSLSEKKFRAEIAKCQLLCSPCHKRKTVLERGQILHDQHGMVGMYRKGCRCAKCRAANAARSREYKRRKRREMAST